MEPARPVADVHDVTATESAWVTSLRRDVQPRWYKRRGKQKGEGTRERWLHGEREQDEDVMRSDKEEEEEEEGSANEEVSLKQCSNVKARESSGGNTARRVRNAS